MEQMMTQAFRTALAKCQASNKYTIDASFEEFADELTRDVFAILFPRTSTQSGPSPASVDVVTIPVVEEAPDTKKKPGPKPKLDESGNPIPKKPRAKKSAGGAASESESESVEAPPVVETAAVEEKVKKPRAKKVVADAPASEGSVNFDKFTPTETKKLKSVATELSVEVDKKALLAYLNGLSKEDFHAKKVDDHFRDFLTPKPAGEKVEETAAEDTECLEIEFKGKTYVVDPKTKRVYEERGDVTEHVGEVGAGDFAGMVLPEDA